MHTNKCIFVYYIVTQNGFSMIVLNQSTAQAENIEEEEEEEDDDVNEERNLISVV